MANKSSKWFKSAFTDESEVTPKKQKIDNGLLRTLSEHDSIDLTGLDDNVTLSSATVSYEPVQIVHTNFKSANWIENFAPQSKTDLAIHTKKIAELDGWFRTIGEQKKGKRLPVPILLITGPSGSGKTASLKVIAKEWKYNVSEWVTPLDNDYENNDVCNNDRNATFGENQNEKFSQFLLQSSRYASVFDSCGGKRLVLVEDFPNIYIKDPSLFEDILDRYSVYGKSPLIFIVTDTKSKTLNIAYNLFPDAIKQKFFISTINFNAVSDTMLRKGLKRICTIMSQPGFQVYYTEPNKDVIDSIVLSSQGDIRNAVINLHFASQKDSCKLSIENFNVKKPTSSFDKKKGSKAFKKNKLKSLGCDETLTVMHALGRVLNPKYNEPADAKEFKTFLHSPEDIAGQFSTQSMNMLTLIHTNYLCHFQDIQDIVNASDILSLADDYLNEWREDLSSEIGINLAVRGTMVWNQNPVTGRWMPIRSAKIQRNGNYDYAKEAKALPGNESISSSVLASDYRTYVKIIQGSKSETT